MQLYRACSQGLGSCRGTCALGAKSSKPTTSNSSTTSKPSSNKSLDDAINKSSKNDMNLSKTTKLLKEYSVKLSQSLGYLN